MTFKVICRKNIVYRDSTSPLCLLFFQGKRKKSIGLGVSVAPAHWDAEAQKVTDDCPDRDNIQFQITAKIKEYEKRIQRLEIMELPVTFENLFEQNGKRVNCTVGDYLKQIIERLEALGKYASASKHRVLCSHLSRFRSLNIRFDEIDLTFLRDFELFLRKNGNASNSIATKFAIFKAAYNKALADGIFIQKVNPFVKYKVGSLWTRTRKRAITKGDIQKLMALEIEPSHKTEYTICKGHLSVLLLYGWHQLYGYGDPALWGHCGRKNLLLPTQDPEAVILPAGAERLADCPEIQQGRPCERGLYLSDSQPKCPSNTTTDFQSDTQGSGKNQSGIKGAGKTDWIGGPIDDLRCPPHIRNRPETVRSKRGTDFRIVGTLRPLDHANLPRFIRERANRRSHTASAVRIGRSAALLVTDLLSSYTVCRQLRRRWARVCLAVLRLHPSMSRRLRSRPTNQRTGGAAMPRRLSVTTFS